MGQLGEWGVEERGTWLDFPLVLAELCEAEPCVFQNLEEKALRKFTCVNGNYKGIASRMFQDQMRARLANLMIAVPEKKADEFRSRNHLFYRERDGLSINGASRWNRLAFLPAVLNVETHGLQDAFLGVFDGLAKPINSGKILAVSVVALAFPFDGNSIAVEGHHTNKLIMKGQAGRVGWP